MLSCLQDIFLAMMLQTWRYDGQRERLAQMDGTLQAKIPHRSPMEIHSEVFSSLLKYYPLRQIRYITSPQTWRLRATSFYVFFHLYSRQYLVPLSSTGAYILPGEAAEQACSSHGGSRKLKRANHWHVNIQNLDRIASALALYWPPQGTQPIPRWSRKLYPTLGGQGRE